MARYIIVSSESGYIVGDTAAYAEGQQIDGPLDAVRLLDHLCGHEADEYVEYNPREAVPGVRSGYYVYSASDDIKVPVITDGADDEQIEGIDRFCELEAFVQRNYDHGWDYS
jgi:hypothetical protein